MQKMLCGKNQIIFGLLILLPHVAQAGVTTPRCPAAQVEACPFDLTCDASVNASDVKVLNAGFGKPGPGDFNHDSTVDGYDLGMLLGAWGPCVRKAAPVIETAPSSLYKQCLRRLRLARKSKTETAAALKSSTCRAYVKSQR